jgi:hypothetical protein
MPIREKNRRAPSDPWQNGKIGTSVVVYVAIAALLVAALLLPPISLVQRIADAGMTRVTSSGATLSDPDGTQVTFPPNSVSGSVRVKLISVPRVTFLEGSAGSDLLAAAKAIPPNLIAKSPLYMVTMHGAAPAESDWLMPIPNDSEPYETLDAYTWDKSSGHWQWLPHTVISDDDQVEVHVAGTPGTVIIMQTNPTQAAAAADVATAQNLSAGSQGALAEIHPTGLALGGNGGIDGSIDASFDKLSSAYSVVPIIQDYSGRIVRTDLLGNMLEDPTQRAAHIDALVNLAVGSAYSGIVIDYHGLDPEDTADFSQFVADLAQKLHAQNKSLAIRVEMPTQVSEDRWDTGAYDWATLGMLADSLQVPAPLDPQAFLPNGQFDAMLRFAVGQVDRYKLEIVFSGQSVEQAGSYFMLKSYGDALQPLLGRIQADQSIVQPNQPLNLSLVSKSDNTGLVYDPNLGTYVYRYRDDQGGARTVWLENAASLSHKLQTLSHYNVRGFVVENLPGGGQDPDLWTLMRNYQQGQAQPFNSNFMVQWTVKDSQGDVITQTEPVANAKMAMLAPGHPGPLNIAAAIEDRQQIVGLATSQDIAVATYTPVASPTPVPPTATPTPSLAQITVSGDLVNVRSGPGTDYDQIGQINAGATYTVTGKSADGSWYEFILNNNNAWVSADLVTLTGVAEAVAVVDVTPEPTSAAGPQPTAAPQATVSSAPPPTGGGSFDYGIQISPWNLGSVTSAIQGMGFHWVKDQLPWKDFEGSPGNINWGGLDNEVATFSGAGLKFLASVPKAPDWARATLAPGAEGPPKDPSTYANFVGQMASRYCGKINAIEVWNEQNLWYEWGHEPLDANRYVTLLSAAYKSIKAACPSTMVISGALTPTGVNDGTTGVDDFVYLTQMYQDGVANVSDGIGAHPSGYNLAPNITYDQGCAFITARHSSFHGACDSPNHSWSFNSTLTGYWNIMSQNGDTGKKIWPTEFGWAIGPAANNNYGYANDNSPQDQATWTVEAYQMMKAWGFVGPAFLWNLNYDVTNPNTELAQWGIMSRGRLTYNALAAMAK